MYNYVYTEEILLSGLNGTTSLPDMQKIRIIGFLFENRLHGSLIGKKKILHTAVLDYIFTYVQIRHNT